MKALSASTVAILGLVLIAGCAQDGTLTTGALNPSVTGPQTADGPDAKTAAACMTLASQIEALNEHGIAEKVSKAAAKKYKMKSADLAKAAELNKANAEFQARCSNYPPPTNVAKAEPEAETPKKTAEKKKPPLPAQKPVVASAAPEKTGSATPPATEPAAATGPSTATATPTTILTTTALPTSAAIPTANSDSAQPAQQP